MGLSLDIWTEGAGQATSYAASVHSTLTYIEVAVIEDDEALVASMAYFQALRREWHKRNGSGHLECPIPAWNDIRAIDQQAFVRSMKIAIAATKPENMRRVMENLGRAF